MAGISLEAESAFFAARAQPRVERTHDVERAHQVAEDFEAFFLGQFLQPLFADLSTEEPFGGGLAEDMWRTLQVDEYGKAMARAGGVGIADAVLKEILILQEAQ